MNHEDYRLVYEDKLLSTWESRKDWRKTITRGKRVPHTCPLTLAERQVYVKEGGAKIVAYLKETRQISLTEAVKLVNEARGGSYSELKLKFKNRFN